MTRAFIIVLDSLGIGGAPDALAHGDVGANTLGHIAAWRAAQGRPLQVPQLEALGLGAAGALACGRWPDGLNLRGDFSGAWASAAQASVGKDTPSGHWEMAGLPNLQPWHHFGQRVPCFPAEFMADWLAAAGLAGALGNCHASGTEIIARLGDEHLRSGWPIVYTSGDSVFQVAAHESHFGLARLHHICELAFERLAPMRVGRVIARPFEGEPGHFKRTAGRKDYAVAPPDPTLLDHAHAAGCAVVALGKVGDIFAHRSIGQEVKASDNAAMAAALLQQADVAPERALVFANFVDFDSAYGHRRDVAGYADALEAFDLHLAAFQARLRPGDLCVITADHGCDPTWPGSDHTREQVPQLFFGPGVRGSCLGARPSFADLGQTLAHHLGLPALSHGTALPCTQPTL